MILLNTVKTPQQLVSKLNSGYVAAEVQLQKIKGCPNLGTGSASLSYHKNIGRVVAFPEYPEDYMELVSERLIDAVPERVVKFSTFERTYPAVPAYVKKEYKFKPHYEIDRLFSNGKGSGTEAVKKVVRTSLADSETNGRVLVHADCIDGHSYPAGFYYKLGFRFCGCHHNQVMEEWLNSGGNRGNAPTISGMMYLPKENIELCVNYGK